MTIYFLSIGIALFFLIIIFELVRQQKLKEQYALLWMTFAVMIVMISFNVTWVERFADWLQVLYSPAILFLFGLLFAFAMILHLTIVLTKLNHQILLLAQELTILKGGESDG